MSEVSLSFRQADFDRNEAMKERMRGDKIFRYQWLAEIEHQKYEMFRDMWGSSAIAAANCCSHAARWYAKRAREEMGIE